MRKHPELPWQSIWHIRYVAIVMPAVWLAAAALIYRLPNRYLRIGVVVLICSYNLINALAREYVQTEVPLDRAMADMYRSQPDSDLRTYFDLKTLTDNVYYRPLAAYNACIAAGMTTTPAEFRVGYAWPFEFGTAANRFKSLCVYSSSVSAATLRRDTARNQKIRRVIVWETDGRFINAVGADALLKALGKNWKMVGDEQIVSHWYFTWSNLWTIHRYEFMKVSGAEPTVILRSTK